MTPLPKSTFGMDVKVKVL